jgi:TolB protein
LAITLSKDGSPDIYILNLNNRNLFRLTKNLAIDTEATWSPDGRSIVFTSDRGGKPQLYQVSSRGGRAERLTFQGGYNARGKFSKDGSKLAMVHGNSGDYRIAVMDIANKSVSVLTDGRLDESPSFAPNGSMLIYAAQKGKQRVLSVVSIDGGMQQRLAFGQGEIREAAWSP